MSVLFSDPIPAGCSRDKGDPLTADVIVRPAEGIYARYPAVEDT